MRKFQTTKRIDLTDRQSTLTRQKHHPQSRLQSLTRSSNKNMSKQHSQNMDCFTDRSKNEKINQFSIGQIGQVDSNNITMTNIVKSNIRTFIRFKPFNRQEIMNQDSDINESGIDIIDDKKVIIDQNYSYSFDRVFGPQSTQKLVYDTTAKQLIKCFINGFNGTIFAYGQTGSGKTYTMFGADDNSTLGIIPQAIQGLFSQIEAQKMSGIKRMELSCSMYEIYKEVICDLMCGERLKQIKIKQSANGNVQIQNLTVKQILSKDELLDLINRGSQMRKIRGTQINQRSSRSHLILTLYLKTKVSQFETRLSKLNLVDLAGSQKVSKTKVSGEGLQQAIKINLSLSCLGNAIYALSKGQQHIPFRDSKLTRVLQQSLSGNSITRVIVTCSMIPSCKQETISSLKFANRIKTIKTCSSQNIRKINQQGINKFMYQTLKASFQNCEQKLQRIKYMIEANFGKLSKQQIIDSLKQVFSSEERLSSQNQFLTLETQPFQAFKSPNKCQFAELESYHQTEPVTIVKEEDKVNETIQDYKDYIKELIQKIQKQNKTIQIQMTEIKQLRKNRIQSSNNEIEQKKGIQKLKILKSNINVNNIGSKLKQVKNKKKQVQESEQRQIITFRTKYDQSGKKTTRTLQSAAIETGRTNCAALNQAKQLLLCLNKKKSYEDMEKQIMIKQIKAFGVQVSKLRKSQSLKQTHGSNLTNAINLNDIETATQNILKTQIKHRDCYISQLQQIIETKISQHSNVSDRICLPHKQSKQKRRIELFASPLASCQLSRANSSKIFTKY